MGRFPTLVAPARQAGGAVASAARNGSRQLLEAGARPVSGGSVAAFRIIFGLAMVINNLWYLRNDRVYAYYVKPAMNFPFSFARFVEPLPGVGMYLVFWGMVATGALIALGLWYRTAAALYFVLTTYKFLIDSTYFQNHDYLISLLAFLLVIIPAHKMWSVHASLRPRSASATVPSWAVWLLQFQMGVVYFFGGVAKLNADWLRGEPLRAWLAARPDFPILGPHFTNETVVWAMTYGSLFFDLFVVGFLLWRRTRLAAFVVALVFHFMNVKLFGLVIFPWLMMAATTIYFRPDWPQVLMGHIRYQSPTLARWFPPPGPPATPYVALPPPPSPPPTSLPPPPPQQQQQQQPPPPPPARPRMRPLLAMFLGFWVASQVLLPLRHYAAEGNPSWSEVGHRFAWHMKLRSKGGVEVVSPEDGIRRPRGVTYELTREGETWIVDPKDYLEGTQLYSLAGSPERIVLFAHFLSDEYDGAEVRAHTRVAFNGRPYTRLVDPEVDLSEVSPFWLGRPDWILEYDVPVPDPDRYQ